MTGFFFTPSRPSKKPSAGQSEIRAALSYIAASRARYRAAGLIFIATVLPIFQSFGQSSLDIKILNIRKNKGKVIVAVFQDPETWLESPLKEVKLTTDADAKTVSFQVPFGTYAVSVYQDTDDNGELDTNFLGIPKEPIGFGNNYKPFGKPKFESAAIEHTATSEPHEIKLDD